MNRVPSSLLLLLLLLLPAAFALVLSACSKTIDPPAGSQTHFLRACDGECGGGLSCVCGVCTESCAGDTSCSAHGQGASCEPAASFASCMEAAQVCDLTCAGDDACGELGDGFSCQAGRCREQDPASDGGTAGTGSPDAGPSSGTGGSAAGGSGGSGGSGGGGGSPSALPCSVDAIDPSLPGVTVHLEGDSCAVPAGQESTFRHFIDVGQPIPYTGLDSGGACGLCGGYSDDPSSLLDVRVTRAEAQYCNCDVGCCPPTSADPHTLMPGRYRGELVWPGREWNGPSDTSQPLGPYFPEGGARVVATLEVPGVGTISATLSLQVLPPVFGPSDPAACLVEGKVYPSGYGNTPDPRSCNTCLCMDGQIDSCTDIGGCDETCPAGTTFATSCAQCGPADACEVVETGCIPTCTTEDDCPGFPSCTDGICRGICG